MLYGKCAAPRLKRALTEAGKLLMLVDILWSWLDSDFRPGHDGLAPDTVELRFGVQRVPWYALKTALRPPVGRVRHYCEFSSGVRSVAVHCRVAEPQ